MGMPEKERKDDTNKNPPPKKGPSEPKSMDDTPMDVFKDIDNYQKKIESEWETTKKNYQDKIDQIMDEFTEASKPSEKPEAAKPSYTKKSNPEFDEFMAEVQKKIQKNDPYPQSFSLTPKERPPIINVNWSPITPWDQGLRKIILGLFALGIVTFGLYKFFFSVADVTPLPYTHTSSLLFHDNRILVVDWFRKSLFTHIPRKGLPLESVENLPNRFTTGLAITDKYFLSLDGFSQQIIEHAHTSDHRVLNEYDAPGKQSAGLFFDGSSVWTFDNAKGKLYKLHKNDFEDIKDEFSVKDISVTSFALENNRVWILDGRSREIHVYRLQEPLRHLASYDLDHFLEGSIPTGFHKERRKIWVVSEDPPLLIKIPLRKLKKHRSDKI